jgi:hypothetical protein
LLLLDVMIFAYPFALRTSFEAFVALNQDVLIEYQYSQQTIEDKIERVVFEKNTYGMSIGSWWLKSNWCCCSHRCGLLRRCSLVQTIL